MSRLIARFLGLGLAACLLLAGCTIKYGRPPATDRIEKELKTQVSTKADVLRALGAPRGYGQARVSYVPGDRVIWFYEFTEAGMLSGNVRFKILLVYFDGDKLDGHLWFGSLPGSPSKVQR